MRTKRLVEGFIDRYYESDYEIVYEDDSYKLYKKK